MPLKAKRFRGPSNENRLPCMTAPHRGRIHFMRHTVAVSRVIMGEFVPGAWGLGVLDLKLRLGFRVQGQCLNRKLPTRYLLLG